MTKATKTPVLDRRLANNLAWGTRVLCGEIQGVALRLDIALSNERKEPTTANAEAVEAAFADALLFGIIMTKSGVAKALVSGHLIKDCPAEIIDETNALRAEKHAA